MTALRHYGIAFASALLTATFAHGATLPPNVLLIAVDDLRPELGCYGAEWVKSPNIDGLAARGMVFQRAYCQQAVCNPSRTSLMTGLRPDRIGVTGNHVHFRDKHPDVVTLPQYFIGQGYHAQSIGKIYHGPFPDGASKTVWDTMGDPRSWSVPTTRFGPRYYYTEEGIRQARQAFLSAYQPNDPGPDDWTKKLVFGPMTEAPDVPDNALYDGKVADAAIETLKKLSDTPSQPFFLAVGFIKPHTPFVAPRKYWDLYDAREIPLAQNPDLPADAPPFAGHNSGEVRRYTDQPAKGPFTVGNQRRLKHGYFACISFVDAQIGRVLDELERLDLADNTIIVLFGDHGWHLGEHGLWGKTTNFELDTRAPLIVSAPQMNARGHSTASLAEFVDIYPTVVELAGLPAPNHVQGTSLVPVLSDPNCQVNDAAFSQYPRGGNADRGGKIMGYSMRTDRYRYTEWIERSAGTVAARELYDHSDDPTETVNLAKQPQHGTLVAQLSRRLAQDRINWNPPAPKANTAPASVAGPESFEASPAGPIADLETLIGNWHAAPGHAEVDNKHHHTGRQCLHLLGGDERTIELKLNRQLPGRGQLRFQAERWTRRSPFSFRVEKKSDGEWSEIYNGDRQVVIGTFRTSVRIDYDDPDIERIRFVCTSPAKSGLLIDDVELVPAIPQRILGVSVDPITLPVLTGISASPLVRVRIDVDGTLNPLSLTSLSAVCDAPTNLEDLESLHVFLTGARATLSAAGDPNCFAGARRLGDAQQPRPQVLFAGAVPLEPGANYVWVAATLDKRANLDREVQVTCSQVAFSDGTTRKPKPANPPGTQRIGVALRRRGDDRTHTFRIPGLATTNHGTLIGVYDIRRRSGGDLPGDIDVGMSRSTDGGRTWESMRTIMDMGNDPKWNYDGIGDPAVLVDRKTGTIWVAATWSHGNRSWVGSGPGLEPEETGQLMLVSSDDDGKTWSRPVNITRQVKRPEWCFLLQGPGKGITMRDGTIVFAAQYQDPVANKRLPHSTIIYSRDHGKTWQVGTGAFDDTTESQVVEIEPGVLMLNCRYNRASVRVVATTRDMGATWDVHATSQRSLIEPRSCMASLIRVDRQREKDLGGWLLFSNPDSTQSRERITIKASRDNGLTWPKEFRLLLDEGRGAGYSCMTMIDDSTVGILYEGSLAQLVFQRVKLQDIIGSTGPPPANQQNAKLGANGIRLASVFGDHMVLQADAELPVWGTAKPESDVTVSLGDQRLDTSADADGRWRVRFPPRKANTIPVTMTIRAGTQEVTISDVLVGEVWLCAGQSNMEWPLSESACAKEELAGAQRPQIRLLNLSGGARGSSGSYLESHLARLVPERFCQGSWAVAAPDSARSFSAVGWYFARALRENLNVPVGVINVAIGGTPTEAWIRREALASDPKLQGLVQGNWLDNERLSEFCRQRGTQNLLRAIQAGDRIPSDVLGPNHSFKPGFMWQAGIQPLIPYAIRGAIWYQGESNAENIARVEEHGRLFPLLVHDWRAQWQQGDFPFLYVQLPAMNRPDWPRFRDQQRRFLRQIDNVGMAITIDTGDPTNVHPVAKQPVGQRLARWALGTTYHQQDRTAISGPLLRKNVGEGDAIVLEFDHVGTGLASSDNQPLRHFEVAGADGRFHAADAKIDGASVIVSSAGVPKPRFARYAWNAYPQPAVNFCNQHGLPASPFTTQSTQELHESARQPISRTNILLIVGEDHGIELSCYGDPVINTPHLDRLASQGILFEHGYVAQTVCSPSRSTIFTGLYPHQNGQLGLATHQYAMFRRWPTSYSLLKQAGYRTGLIGKTHVNPEDAVEAFVDFRFQPKANFAKRNVADYAVKAGEFFRASSEPFFMTVNYPDAHWPLQDVVDDLPSRQMDESKLQVMPYVGGDTPRLRGHVKNYYNCMLRLDECVGGLLAELDRAGKTDNTLVVFIGDHGAQFARGKVTVYEGGLRVPFIARWPGSIRPGQRSEALVSTIDLLPTFLDVAGIDSAGSGLPGKSLRSAFDANEGAGFRTYLFGERNCDAAHIHFPQRTVRDARFKLIYTMLPEREDPAALYYHRHGASHWAGSLDKDELAAASQVVQDGYRRWFKPPQIQLYDLETDPHEWTDLGQEAQYDDVKRRLLQTLRRWQQDTADPLADPENLRRLTLENDEAVKANTRIPPGGWRYHEYLDSRN